jgi:hypothetical protein
MRVLVLIKATEQSEAGEMPSQELLEQMTAFNEELVRSGVMLAGEGLRPSSEGVRVDAGERHSAGRAAPRPRRLVASVKRAFRVSGGSRDGRRALGSATRGPAVLAGYASGECRVDVVLSDLGHR